MAQLDIDSHEPAAFGEEERAALYRWAGRDDLREAVALLIERPDWREDQALTDRLRAPFMRLCARYLETTRGDGRPIDPVARFHFKNGARLERVNWMANASVNGLRESLGLMVNYRYVREEIERNHEAYLEKGRLALSSEVKALLKPQR